MSGTPSLIEQVQAELTGIKNFIADRVKEGTEPLAAEMGRVTKAYNDVQAALKEIQRRDIADTSKDGKFIVRNGRLAGFDLLNLRLLEEVVAKRFEKYHDDKSAKLLEEIATQRGEVAKTVNVDSILAWHEFAVQRRLAGFGTVPQAAKAMYESAVNSWSRDAIGQVTKAMDSTTSGSGSQVVPTFEAAQLWMDVNLATQVLGLIPQVQMPTNPFDWPAQFGNTNWYPIDENVQVTTTDLATAKATLTAYGLKTGVPFSDELEEDSIVAFIPELRAQLALNAAQIIDDVLLNADTATTNNINASNATINKTTAGKAQWLLGFKGMILLPLSDNTTMRTDRNAALTAAMFNGSLVKIGKYAIGAQRGDVGFIADVNTSLKAQALAQVETMEKYQQRATISTGELTQLYGRPLIASQQMLLADTNGSVKSGGNATSTGRILTTNFTQWKVGFRRQITMENFREPGKGQTTMYVSFRIALTERTGTRSTATHTALEYDITGVTS